jgi:hypothetical protein
MGNMFVVNAPYLFAGVWSMVKGFLDERTRNKIKIIGSGFEKTLLEFIDAETLPTFLGGTCTCAELGGCINSNIGPWNEYEHVKPRGVRRIGSGKPAAIEETKMEVVVEKVTQMFEQITIQQQEVQTN